MNLALRPEIQQLIEEQVKSGLFPSPEALVEAAIVEWCAAPTEEADEIELDAETRTAIEEGLRQADRGEGIELSELRNDFAKRFRSK